jgi:uncharacterized membrane protein YgcG/tetratricopeptide (TPR) repeat protein
MKLSHYRKLEWILLFSCSVALFCFVGVKQFAQTRIKTPARTGHVSDFAGVLDEQTRLQLGNTLENVKQKTGIEFALVTVESTAGQDIFDFSRRLAGEWNLGARTSRAKSLLLVLAVNEKTSFIQFSKSVQSDLPEGILGEVGLRMRAPVSEGRFGEGLSAGVQHFVRLMAQKLALNTEDFGKMPVPVTVAERTPSKPADESIVEVSSPAKNATRPLRVKPVQVHDPGVSPNPSKPAASEDDAADAEEVELTLTLPVEARVTKLKAFLERNPQSKSKARAMELLVSAHAAVGDERLKKGDSAGGIEQLMLAISQAPLSSSEKLFSGVIAQIPLNLYLRGQRAAALTAARNIEEKFGLDPRRLLAVAGFYLGTEQGGEAVRTATRAVSLAPDLAEAHQALGLALHISLRLDEAVSAYKKALELNPNSKGARRGLADLHRALGRSEEALVLYREQIVAEPNDKAARAGLVLSLLDLGRNNEAKSELDSALNADPRNLALLSGAAYWFAAHNDGPQAIELGRKAIDLEPRYTWSQVAVARALIAQQKPLEAERAIRFAQQYGKFPTLDYELASALAAAGLYDEAAESLVRSFTLKDGQIETRLAGHIAARGTNFTELLAPERRASIFQSVAPDTEKNAKTLKDLLTFASLIDADKNGGTINELNAIAAARQFASGDDAARAHRQLYAASRLLQKQIGFQTAYELAEAARTTADMGMTVPALTVAVQADEYREIRARAIAQGATPDIPEAPRNVLSNLLRGRIEDISGWALFNQDKLDEAADHLRRAANILPAGTPSWRTALWHLGAALERQGNKEEALVNYIKSYNTGELDPVRRTVIENLYRKVHGSLAGLDDQIRLGGTMGANVASLAPETTPATEQPIPAPGNTALETSSPEVTPTPEVITSPAAETPAAQPSPSTEMPQPSEVTPTPEVVASPTPETPAAQPSPSMEATPSPSPTPEQSPAPETTPSLAATPVETMHERRTTVVTITGRVKDSNNNPIANVVVVLISPQGTVLASTTNEEGIYLFKVASSPHSYRLIPSREGFTFEPLDKVLPAASEDQKELDFIAAPAKSP